MMEGEFESLRAIHAVSPELVPYPYKWGVFDQEAASVPMSIFLLADYREVGEQPPRKLDRSTKVVVSASSVFSGGDRLVLALDRSRGCSLVWFRIRRSCRPLLVINDVQ